MRSIPHVKTQINANKRKATQTNATQRKTVKSKIGAHSRQNPKKVILGCKTRRLQPTYSFRGKRATMHDSKEDRSNILIFKCMSTDVGHGPIYYKHPPSEKQIHSLREKRATTHGGRKDQYIRTWQSMTDNTSLRHQQAL